MTVAVIIAADLPRGVYRSLAIIAEGHEQGVLGPVEVGYTATDVYYRQVLNNGSRTHIRRDNITGWEVTPTGILIIRVAEREERPGR